MAFIWSQVEAESLNYRRSAAGSCPTSGQVKCSIPTESLVRRTGPYDANGNRVAVSPPAAEGPIVNEVKIEGDGLATVRATRQRNEYEMDSREISEDGSRIVFTPAEPFVVGGEQRSIQRV